MIGTMNREGVLALYAYNAYANKLVLDTLEKLTLAQFEQPSSPSHGSVRELLLHILDCEAFFLSQCQEGLVDFEALHCLALPGIREYWDRLEEQQTEFIAGLNDTALAREISVPLRGQQYIFPVWQLLLQALVHSVHHRGELSIVLTGLGYPLPTLDILLHFIQESGQVWI